MSDPLDGIMQKLEDNIQSDEFIAICYDAVDALNEVSYGIVAVSTILSLMERYPMVNYGSPGPLTHYMEAYFKKGYEKELVASVKRYPTQHTVWLLHRVINGMQGAEQMYYRKVLEDVAGYEIDE